MQGLPLEVHSGLVGHQALKPFAGQGVYLAVLSESGAGFDEAETGCFA